MVSWVQPETLLECHPRCSVFSSVTTQPPPRAHRSRHVDTRIKQVTLKVLLFRQYCRVYGKYGKEARLCRRVGTTVVQMRASNYIVGVFDGQE